MPEYPYFLELSIVLAASSSGTLSFPVPNSEVLRLTRVVYVSTGIFNITDIRSTRGIHYTNASPANPITSTQIQNAGNAFRSIMDFNGEIVIEGGETLIIDLVDTSVALNTIQLLLSGIKETG